MGDRVGDGVERAVSPHHPRSDAAGISGTDVLQRLQRAGNSAAVLVLTARDSPSDKVRQFEAADVACAYIDLRGLQTRLAITRQHIITAREFRDIAQQRAERGLTNELDVDLAGRELARLQSAFAPLMAQTHAAQNSIAALLGRCPEDLAAELAEPGRIPDIPEEIAPGRPINLLERCAGIREAERQLAAATARVGVATANLFARLA